MQTAVYVRLSDEDRNKRFADDESESIQNQKSLLVGYCKERGWDIYDIYCDEDYSGTDSDRPDFNRMLADCERGKIDIVLCKSQSRFSRDMEVIEKYLHNKFSEWNVRFVSVIDHADSFDCANKKTRQINGLVNEWYCEEVSENVRKVLQHKREEGQFTGSFAPYGYIIDPDNKNHLVIDENAAAVVRRIFDLYDRGYGYRKIAATLNEEGIPSPSEYKRRLCGSYRNLNAENSASAGLWTNSTICKMLRSQVYIGSLVQGKSHSVSYKNKKRLKVPEDRWIVVKNAHLPIIDGQTWKNVQARLAGKQRCGKFSGELSPLSGKVKCAVCGSSMKRNVYHNKKGDRTYYNLVCGCCKTGAMNCSNRSAVSGMQLERLILSELNKLLDKYYDVDMIEEVRRSDEEISQLAKSCEDIRHKITQTENKLEKTYENLLDEVISQEEYKLFSARLSGKLTSLKASLEEAQAELEKLENSDDDEENERCILEKYRHIQVLTRIVADEFIDQVQVGETIEGQSRKVTIIWKI